MTIGVGGIYVDIRGDSSGLNTALASARLSTASTATSINKGTTSITSGFKNMVAGINPAVVAIGAVTVGAVAVGAALVSAARIGMEFEQTMKTVSAVSGATAKEYEWLEAAARLMGATTEWSASQSAEALKYLSMAGLQVADSIEALPGMLDLATAAQMDLGQAADIVTDTLTAFGMKTSELTRLSDAFINTSTKSNTTVQMLGESFKYVAPIAAQMGYDVEQTAGYLGVMANAGIKAGDAGTDLRQVLLRTSKAAVALGMDVESSLNDVLKEMYNRQLSANEVTELFGMIASKTAMVLMNNVDVIGVLTDKINEGSGATEKMAEIMRSSAKIMKDVFVSQMEEISLSIYDTMEVDLKESIQVATGFFEDNTDVIVDWAGKLIVASGAAFDVLIVGAGFVSESFVAMSMIWDSLKLTISELAYAVNGAFLTILETTKKLNDFAPNVFRFEMSGAIDYLRNSQEYLNKTIIDTQLHIHDLGTGGSKIINAFSLVIGDSEEAVKDVSVAAVSSAKTQKEAHGELTDAVVGNNKEIAEATSQMYDSIKFESDQYYDFKKTQYQDEYNSYVDLTGDVKNAQIKLNSDLKKLDEDMEIFRDEKINNALISFFSANDKMEAYQSKKFEKEMAEAEKISEKKAQYTKDMYQSINLSGQEAYDYSMSLLNAQEMEYARYIDDAVLLATWRQEREKEINDQRILDTGSFFEGMKLGYADLLESQMTWAEAGKGVFKDFSEIGANTLSDTLFSVIKGDISSLGDIWSSAMDSMLKSLVDTVAQMLIEWAVIKGMNAITGMLGFEAGAWDFGAAVPDSKGNPGTVAVVHDGEMIIPAGVADSLRASLGHEGVTDFDSLYAVLSNPTISGQLEGATVAELLYDAFQMYGHNSNNTVLKKLDWESIEYRGLADNLLNHFLASSYTIGTDPVLKQTFYMKDTYKDAYDSLYSMDNPYAEINKFVSGGGINSSPSIYDNITGNSLYSAGTLAAGSSQFVDNFAAGMLSSTVGNLAGFGSFAAISDYVDAGDALGATFSPEALQGSAVAGLAYAINSSLGTNASKWGGKTALFGSAYGGLIGGMPGSLIGSVLGSALGNTVGDALDAREYESTMDAFESMAIDNSREKYGNFFGTVLGQINGDRAFMSMARVVGAAHGGKAVVSDYLDPIDYGTDYGFQESGGYGTGTVSGINTGGGFGDMAPGFGDSYGVHGMKDGGVINKLLVPDGEDGLLPVQFGEGVISKQGMSALNSLNKGNLGGNENSMIAELIDANKKVVRLLRKFDTEGLAVRA